MVRVLLGVAVLVQGTLALNMSPVMTPRQAAVTTRGAVLDIE